MFLALGIYGFIGEGEVCGSNYYLLFLISPLSPLKWGRQGTGGRPVASGGLLPEGLVSIPLHSRFNGEEAGAALGGLADHTSQHFTDCL